ncbi:MAG: hypothetical protein HQL95_03280 [Magnetococcales bacterium]|nr:hypothetical protein [Magnetococcales bacterium]
MSTKQSFDAVPAILEGSVDATPDLERYAHFAQVTREMQQQVEKARSEMDKRARDHRFG